MKQLPKRYSKPNDEEYNSGIPVAQTVSAGPESLEETVARMLAYHLTAKQSSNEGPESWEEANDFEPDWDEDLLPFESKYELADLNPEEVALGYPLEPTQEAPQEEISTPEGPTPQSKEETPSGASE